MLLDSKITGVVLTKNEKLKISACLMSLNFCDEVIVIDDNSVDNTISIAKKHKARVYVHSLNGDFAKQRNFGLSKVKTEWALFIDADEVVPYELAQEIRSKVRNSDVNGYLVNRQDIFLGKVLLGGEFSSYKLRLGRVTSGKWERSVHETWNIKGLTKKLNAPLIHNSHDSIHQFVSQIAYFSNMHSRAKDMTHKGVSMMRVLFYPMLKFLQLFLVKGGYRDGTHGFVANMMLSFHSFLAWSHLYLKKYKR